MQSALQRKLDGVEAERRREAVELQQHRQYRQEQQQRAEQLKLRQWSKQHPEHTKFQGLLQRAQTVRQQLAGVDPKLPPEQQDAIKAAIVSAISPDEQQTLQEYQQESQGFQRDFFIDPRGTLQPILHEAIQQAFDQYRLHQQASSVVEKDFQDLQPALQQHGPELRSMLERGTPYDVALENVKLKQQLGALQNRAGEAEKAKVAANAQQQLAKGNASITRDPVATSKPDLYAMAKKEAAEKGIRTDDPRFMGIISRLEANLIKT